MTFTASNGITVWIDVRSETHTDYASRVHVKLSDRTQALREFFQHERDEELGRWRWPENPDYVVYPDRDGHVNLVVALNELTGVGAHETRDQVANLQSGYGGSARAYFEAHPEPKPWGDALPGQLWKVDTRNQEGLFTWCIWTVDGSRFVTSNGTEYDTDDVIAGRKIWPEP